MASFVSPDADYALSYSPLPLTIAPEDARSTYTGPAYVNTSSAAAYMATIPLSFTIRDITAVGPFKAGSSTTPASGDEAYDPSPGNINNAYVKIVDALTNTAMCATTALAPLSAGDTTTVTATCSFVARLPTSGASAGFQTYAPQAVVGGYYLDANTVSEQALLTVAIPLTSNFASAGGGILEAASSGLLPGALGTRTHFGVNVKYNKSGTNLQGSAYAVIRSTVVAPGDTCPADANGYHVYRFKANSITSVTAQTSSSPSTATVVGAANIVDFTSTARSTCSYSVDGGATLQITMTDGGNTGDTIGIAIWQAPNKGGNLWFSSNLVNGRTTELPLANGSLSVH